MWQAALFFLYLQIDQLKQELSKKESELLALQTKLETLNNQNSDCKQHIEVLKESLTAKEQRAAILQTEVNSSLVCARKCQHTVTVNLTQHSLSQKNIFSYLEPSRANNKLSRVWGLLQRIISALYLLFVVWNELRCDPGHPVKNGNVRLTVTAHWIYNIWKLR